MFDMVREASFGLNNNYQTKGCYQYYYLSYLNWSYKNQAVGKVGLNELQSLIDFIIYVHFGGHSSWHYQLIFLSPHFPFSLFTLER